VDRGSRHRCRDTCRPHDLLGRQVVGERPLRELPLLGLPERAAHGHVGLSRRLTSVRSMTAIGAQLPVLQASVALKLPLARHQPASAHSRWGSRLFAPGSIRVRHRKIVIPQKTGRLVQFENQRAGSNRDRRVAVGLGRERRALSLPEPYPGATEPLDETVRPHRSSMDGPHRSG
jgi:hypothetical protein